jgi:hypothetical protein
MILPFEGGRADFKGLVGKTGFEGRVGLGAIVNTIGDLDREVFWFLLMQATRTFWFMHGIR